MGQAEIEKRPPFRLPEHAVRFAFSIDDNPICETSRFFRDLRGGTVKLPGDDPLSPWDRVSQAGMVLAIMQRHLTRDQQAILVARYVRPITEEISRVKQKSLLRSMNLVQPELPPEIPYKYLVDVVRGWAGLPREHKDLWWSDHLDVHMRTLRNWCRGRRQKDRRFWGILSLLEYFEQKCYECLLDPMIEACLVEDNSLTLEIEHDRD